MHCRFFLFVCWIQVFRCLFIVCILYQLTSHMKATSRLERCRTEPIFFSDIFFAGACLPHCSSFGQLRNESSLNLIDKGYLSGPRLFNDFSLTAVLRSDQGQIEPDNSGSAYYPLPSTFLARDIYRASLLLKQVPALVIAFDLS